MGVRESLYDPRCETWVTIHKKVRFVNRSKDLPPLCKAHVTVSTDDQMVVQRYPQDLPRLGELVRYRDILPARFGVPARVVVNDKHGGAYVVDRRLENLARMHQARVERPV